jgi:inhibitor of cysteine peptidase
MVPRPGNAAARILCLILGLLPGLAAGPATAGQLPEKGTRPMPTITLSRADDGRSVELGVGDTVVLRLEENPTTGYQWALDQDSGDVLALRASDDVGSPGSAVGGGGERAFTFTASKAGRATARLKL